MKINSTSFVSDQGSKSALQASIRGIQEFSSVETEKTKRRLLPKFSGQREKHFPTLMQAASSLCPNDFLIFFTQKVEPIQKYNAPRTGVNL